jgi:arginine/lysine/ornithine decarboxylase
VHKSAINGLILAGAEPVFLSPVYDKEWDICHGIPIEGDGGLEKALEEHAPGGEVAAVLLVSPTYHGAIMDIKQAALLCAKHKIPLVVDEAHGAHLAFLELDEQATAALGPAAAVALEGALAQGADLVVQSTHKTLTAVSQCAMMHAGNGPLVDEGLLEFVGSALQFVQSSSPNYVLLASLDGARWQLAAPAGEGREALRRALVLAEKARRLLRSETPFPVLDLPGMPTTGGAFVGLDPLRMTVGMMGTGMSGFDADEVLIEEHGVYAELPASRTLTFAVGPGSMEEDVDRLVAAFKALAASSVLEEKEEEEGGEATKKVIAEFPSFDGQQAAVGARRCGPREAYFTASEIMSTSDASIVGRASAETVCPYPPGIPVLLPGEIITVEVLRFLQGVLDAGGSVTGCSDPSLGKLRVLCLE